MEPEGKAEKELVFVVLLEQEWPEERLLRLRGAFQAQVLQPPPLSGRDLGALRHLCADMCVKAGVGAPGPQGSRVPDEALRAFEQQRDCMEPLRVAAGKVSDPTDPDRADKARKEFLSCGGASSFLAAVVVVVVVVVVARLRRSNIHRRRTASERDGGVPKEAWGARSLSLSLPPFSLSHPPPTHG